MHVSQLILCRFGWFLDMFFRISVCTKYPKIMHFWPIRKALQKMLISPYGSDIFRKFSDILCSYARSTYITKISSKYHLWAELWPISAISGYPRISEISPKFFRIRIPRPWKPPGTKNLDIWSIHIRNTCTYLKKRPKKRPLKSLCTNFLPLRLKFLRWGFLHMIDKAL